MRLNEALTDCSENILVMIRLEFPLSCKKARFAIHANSLPPVDKGKATFALRTLNVREEELPCELAGLGSAVAVVDGDEDVVDVAVVRATHALDVHAVLHVLAPALESGHGEAEARANSSF